MTPNCLHYVPPMSKSLLSFLFVIDDEILSDDYWLCGAKSSFSSLIAICVYLFFRIWTKHSVSLWNVQLPLSASVSHSQRRSQLEMGFTSPKWWWCGLSAIYMGGWYVGGSQIGLWFFRFSDLPLSVVTRGILWSLWLNLNLLVT